MDGLSFVCGLLFGMVFSCFCINFIVKSIVKNNTPNDDADWWKNS